MCLKVVGVVNSLKDWTDVGEKAKGERYSALDVTSWLELRLIDFWEDCCCCDKITFLLGVDTIEISVRDFLIEESGALTALLSLLNIGVKILSIKSGFLDLTFSVLAGTID